jgi:hypothetical protein
MNGTGIATYVFTLPGVTGHIILVTMLIMAITAIDRVRRRNFSIGKKKVSISSILPFLKYADWRIQHLLVLSSGKKMYGVTCKY